MKIAVVASPYIEVPPLTYGGAERKVSMICEGLLERGHEVILFAKPGSTGPASRIVFYGSRVGRFRRPVHGFDFAMLLAMVELAVLFKKYRKDIDVVNNFARVAYGQVAAFLGIPLVQSFGSPVNDCSLRRLGNIANSRFALVANSVSLRQSSKLFPERWNVVHNPVDLGRKHKPGADSVTSALVYLGRITYVKGVHIAIMAALIAGREIDICGDAFDESDRSYFERFVYPFVDGCKVRFHGAVDDKVKACVLSRSEAMLFPCLWDDPFPNTVLESLACGTPVVAFPRGGIPEMVVDGLNGFLCDDVYGIVKAISLLPTISRENCIYSVADRFSIDAISRDYESIYSALLSN